MEGGGKTGARRRRRQSANYRRRSTRSGNYRRLRSSALYASSAFFIMTPAHLRNINAHRFLAICYLRFQLFSLVFGSLKNLLMFKRGIKLSNV